MISLHSPKANNSLNDPDELEQFVYTVTHDLKLPLVTGIEKLEKVAKANERMSQLINDLLDFSRVGRVDLDTHQRWCQGH